MPINTNPHFIGRASISPDGRVVVRHVGTWTITYEVGAYGRIHVELAVNGLPMGAEGRATGAVNVAGRVVGTGPLERVDIFRGLDLIRTVSPYGPESFAGSNRYRIAWAGSRVRGRDRLTTWAGHVELSAGRFVNAVTFAMENPEKGIRERSDTRIAGVSNTTGDDDGIDVTVAAPTDAVLRFHSPVIRLEVAVRDLADGQTRAFPAGGVELRVFMRRPSARGQS